jgi:hypothetical protein
MALRRCIALAALFALSSSMAACAAPSEQEDDVASGEDAVVETEGKPVISGDANRLVDVPFYFTVPKDATTVPLNRRGYSYPTLWNPSKEVDSTGLRIIAINQKLPMQQLLPADTSRQAAVKLQLARANASAKKAARRDMAKQLATSGVLQPGDIVLSFRPENAATVPYMHVQMGSTHASLAYIKDGVAKNVDAPMNDEYIGGFDSLHFSGGTNAQGGGDLGTDALQIFRPRALAESQERRDRMNAWAAKAAATRGNGRVSFNTDYLAPSATDADAVRKLATALGKAIIGAPGPSIKIFCSEFAYNMLALSSCSEEEIRSAGADGAACVDPLFDPLPMLSADDGVVGLGEGPLASVLGAPPDQRGALIEQMFTSMAAANMSSGHRATAEATGPLMAPLKQYYQARAAGSPANNPQLAPIFQGLNGNVKPNYSPTAFHALSTKSGTRIMDYVATVVFVDNDTDFDKAKRLAQNPVP